MRQCAFDADRTLHLIVGGDNKGLAYDRRVKAVADRGARLDVLDGSADNLRPWATLRDIPAGERSGADGVAVDSDGRLYVTTVAGLQVFDEAGSYLETLEFPQQPTNVAFGGPDRMTLYVTAITGVYSLRMATAGPADRAK